jgi:hypothetical protein
MKLTKVALLTAAGMNFFLALFHFAFFAFTPGAMEFFETPDSLRSAGLPKLVLVSVVFGALFALFAVYALSGARIGPRLPLLRTGLVAIAAVFLLRGILIFQELRLSAIRPGIIIPPQEFAFSAIAFFIGLLYAAGLKGQWSASPK